jgi:hypothetical protein
VERTLTILFMVVVRTAAAQWTVPAPIVMDGPEATDRRVTGLAVPQDQDHGANLDAERYNTVRSGMAEGIDALTVDLYPALDAYRPGLRLTLIASATNEGDVTVDVNGLGSVPVRKDVVLPLDSADLRTGVPFDLVYDGSVFHVTNQVHPSCPSGFIPVGREVCVETAPHAASGWYAAARQCTAQGHRLCSFAEWMAACLMPNGIFPSVMDYEWVDSAANSLNYAKLMGNSDVLGLDCRAGSHRIPTGSAMYRCCSDR